MPGKNSEEACLELEAVMNEYSDMVYRIALTRLRHVQDAEDAYQETFLTYYRKNRSFADEAHRKAWLIRVTLNCCKRELAKRAKHSALPLEETDAAAEMRFDDPVISAVMELPERLRTAVELHYFEGLTAKETASLLRTSEAAVYMRLARGRSLLREKLEGDTDL